MKAPVYLMKYPNEILMKGQEDPMKYSNENSMK